MSNWTEEQKAIPLSLFDIMEQCEYLIACADAPKADRLAALAEVAEWCGDLRVFVQTEIPMADSDRFPTRVASYADNAATRKA